MNKKELAKLRAEFEKGVEGAPIVEGDSMLDEAARMLLTGMPSGRRVQRALGLDDVQEFEPYNEDDILDPTTQRVVEHDEGMASGYRPQAEQERLFRSRYGDPSKLHYPDAIDIGEITHSKKETEQ